MRKIEGAKAFIEKVRSIDESLRHIKLCNIELDRGARSALFRFICDCTVGEDLHDKIAECCVSVTPESFTSIEAQITKIVADPELIAAKIYSFVKSGYPSLCFEFSAADVVVEKRGDEFFYTLKMIPSSCEYCRINGVVDKINAELDRSFCEVFSGMIEEKARKEKVELRTTVVTGRDLQTVSKRTIEVTDVVVIDDVSAVTTALYIDDADSPGEVTLCGKITAIRKKETVNGKPFFIFDFTDTTGTIGGIYFTHKNTLEKISALVEGDEIIVRGKLDYYKEKLSLTINRINRCKFPVGFTPVHRSGNSAPLEYKLIFPKAAENVKVSTIFDGSSDLPECLTKGTFVVFDLETTGKEPDRDEIIEIGAVSVKNGRIAETFQTLVKPTRSIDDFIRKLTGIDDEMVKDAPSFADVLPDFYKFVQGSVLVAHNSDFDCKFIKYHSKALNYYFDNGTIDTVQFAHDAVPGLSNYKLNTVAEHFHVEFRHHRALSDAYATAEIFIELAKIKKSLPVF